MPGSWQRYYERWKELTLERIDPRLIVLLTLYRNRFSQQIETASSETILARWD